jgi:hypothetical protein
MSGSPHTDHRLTVPRSEAVRNSLGCHSGSATAMTADTPTPGYGTHARNSVPAGGGFLRCALCRP